jgi:hypothetical protein
MASSLLAGAPWLNLLLDEVGGAKEPGDSGTQRDPTGRWTQVIDDAQLPAGLTKELMVEAAEAPLVFLVPLGKGKVALMHHMVPTTGERGRTWVGLAGFGARAPWRTLDEENFQKAMVGPTVSGSIRDQTLPSTRQFLELTSQEGVRSLKGESKKDDEEVDSVNILQGTALVQVLEPAVLAHLDQGGRTSVPASEVILSIVEYLKEVTRGSSEEAGPGWEIILRRLWVVAKEFTAGVKLGYPPEGDEALDAHCIRVFRALARMTEPRKESGATSPKKRKMEERASNETPLKKKSSKGKSTRTMPVEAGEETVGSPGKERKGGKKVDQEEPGENSPEDPIDFEPSGDPKGDSPQKKKTRRGEAMRMAPGEEPDGGTSGSDSSDGSEDDGSGDDGISLPTLGQKRRDKGSLSLLTETIARAVDQMAIYQKEKVEAERKKTTLLVAWTDDALDLFRILSARDWGETGLPELNEFVLETIRDKKPNRAINRIEQAGRRWDGLPSPNGLIEFFARGFLAQDVLEEPGGFTIFMCRPRDHITPRSDMEKKQAYQDIFGSGELSDETLKAFAKKDWFVPTDRYEAMEQLSVGITFLDLLTSHRGIASIGFRHGLRLLKENSTRVKAELRRDKLFLLKYQHLLDAVFQRFCERLSKLSHLREPLKEARRERLDRLQVEMIDGALGSFFDLGITPALSLPGSIERFAAKGRDKIKDPPPDKKGDEGEKKPRPADSAPKENTPAKKVGWHVANPSREMDWCPPAGVEFNSIFGKGMFENHKGFPKFKHHSRSGEAAMCIRYQILGKCHGGKECRGAHIPTDRMKADEKAAVDVRIKELYRP